MALRVPRNPDTRAATRQQAFQDPAPGLDIRPITQGIDQLRAKLDEDRRNKQKFDLNRRLVAEVNELQADFERRKRDPSIGVDTFAETTDNDYTTRHTQLVDQLYSDGVDEDLLDDFDARLGTVRQGLFGNALAHQTGTLRTRADEELNQFGVSVSQLAASNPLAWPSVEEEIRETVSLNPYLTEAEQIAKTDELIGIARQGAAKAYALQAPEDVIRLLDPQGFTAPVGVGTAGNAPSVSNATGWPGVATTVANELGLNATEVAAVMSFESAGTFDPTIKGGDGGNYMGLIQFGPEERRTYGITETSTPEEWSAAILGFMKDRGFKKGMGLEDFYSTILTGGPGRYNAQDSNGTSVRNAIPRILSEHLPNAERWLQSATIDPGASTAEPAPQVDVPEVDPATTVAEVQTGVPILDALTGPERLQVLGWAREQTNRAVASNKAAMDVTLRNITAEALNNGGEIATPLPTEAEVLATYGPVEGPQRWAQVQSSIQTGKAVQTFRTMSESSIADSLALLEPEPGSPTYATELEVYEGAQRAAAALAQERQQDPAAYAQKYFPAVAQAAEAGGVEYYRQLDRAYDQLGTPDDDRLAFPQAMIDELGQQYTRQTPEQKLATIQTSIEQMGPEMAGRTLGKAAGSEIAADIATYATLRRSPNYQTTFAEILRGKNVIKNDPARAPSQSFINQQFAAGISTSINNLDPNISRAMNEAAAAIYVQRGGRTGKDNNGGELFDKDLYAEALRMATGGSGRAGTGLVDMTRGRVTDWTILPSGVSQTQFENWVDQLEPGDLTRLAGGRSPVDNSGRPLPLEDIVDEGVFVMLAPGRYGIKMGSDGKWLADNTGQRFTMYLDLRPVR